MMNNKLSKKLSLYVVTATLMSAGFMNQAHAAGYEKSIMWGGRSAGVAGIATPYIQGSEALYFNPAGLVSDKVGQDVSLNISPTFSQYSAPIGAADQMASSNHSITTPFGLIYGATLNDKIGFGVGGYISGGNEAVYSGAAIGGGAKGDIKTALQIGEISAGVGYKVTDSLKLGASYRVIMAQASLSTVSQVAAGVFGQTYVTALKDTEFTGFKLGAQYKLDDKTLVGLTYRSEVNLKANGHSTTYNVASGATLADGSTTMRTTFPMQLTLGSQHDCSESWKTMMELAWAQYSRVRNITLDSGPIVQNWQDQFNVRLGAEYHGYSWPIRFGYGWTNQVTSSAYPRPTFTPPGMAHTLTVGSGQSFAMLGSPLQLDGGLEYTFASGNSKNVAAGNGDGKYSVNEMGVHLGAVYAF